MERVSQFGLVAIVVSFVLSMSVPGEAETPETSVSAKIGGNWSLLSGPEDPRGEPTLISGSAFDGYGFAAGATLQHKLAHSAHGTFELEGGLLFSSHRTGGYEERNSGARREVTLESGLFRLPVLLNLRQAGASVDTRIGVGLEGLVGLYSGADVVHHNTSEEAEPLETTPTRHLGFAAAVGVDWRRGSDWHIPLEVRFTWDPFVAPSTRERFDSYDGMDEPGAYRVAYDWQILFLTGIGFGL